MQSDPNGEKRPYSPPTVTKLSFTQAKEVVASHFRCSDQQATDWLESLRQQHQRNKESTSLPQR
jgi:hypothetical protein